MPRTICYALLAALLLAPGLAAADTIPLQVTLTPQPADLSDLDHHLVYLWGFDLPVDQGLELTAATLTFDNIRDWTHEPNLLSVHLLDYAALGVRTVTDNQGGGDYFVTRYTGANRHLVTYRNLSTKPQDLVYVFSNDDVAALAGYLADGRAGLGFDPDCHFFNDGVELTLTYTPEPPSLGLLVLGGLGLLRRRRAA
jgi:hypothetical protein